MANGGKKIRSNCPISFALEHFGDRWTLLIIRDLMFMGKYTFGEFLQAGEGMASNILSHRLKKLVQEGIINKSRNQDNKRQFLYSLTDKGLDLAPVLLEMIVWSSSYDSKSATPKKFLTLIKNNRNGLLNMIRSGEIIR